MKENLKKLAAIVIAFVMVITFMPSMGTEAAYAESKTLTLHFSSIDGGDELVDPIEIKGMDANGTIEAALYLLYNKADLSDTFFVKAGYTDTGLRTPEPITAYKDYYDAVMDEVSEMDKIADCSDVYILMGKNLKNITIEATIDPHICNITTDTPMVYGSGSPRYNTGAQTNKPVFTAPEGAHYQFSYYYDLNTGETPFAYWMKEASYNSDPFIGTFEGGKTYYASVFALAEIGYAYKNNMAGAKITGGTYVETGVEESPLLTIIQPFFVKVKALHTWNSGKVTKEPTLSNTGVKTYTCKACRKTKTETIPKLQMGSDGTAVGEGASAEIADQKITSMKTDTDPKGSKFNKLRLRSTYQTKTSITLKWKSNKKAEKYVIYGNRCGTSTKIRKSVKLYTVKKSTKTTMTKVIKKVKGAAVKKNTYYKFLVVALNKKNEVVSTSRMIHVATKGGKYTNYKKISVDKEKITKAKNLKKGKSLKLEPKQVKVTKSLKARKHVPIRYESSNKKIAKVTSKGEIKALKKGTCYVYVYAQNGVYKKIKVVVK